MRPSKPLLTLAFLFLAASAAPAAEIPEKGLFVTVIQDPPVLSERNAIHTLVGRAKKSGVQVLFVQVYRANKAWFPTQNADVSEYEKAVKRVGEDPLALLIRRAHGAGIEVHAWMNLLSLSANTEAPLLKRYGPSILTQNARSKTSIEEYRIDNQFFLEPGDPRVGGTLTNIVEELVSRYPLLDGVQFDYIRYPDENPAYGYSTVNLERYRAATRRDPAGEQDPLWRHWKREQVTALVRRLKNKARSVSPQIEVSVTGLMPYSRAREEAFQDWKAWVDSGLVDFVTLMAYAKDTPQFERYIKDAQTHLPGLEKVVLAVGAYQLQDEPKEFSDQWSRCEASAGAACAALDYGSLRDGMLMGTAKRKR
jgi:uncharacterized lipoprotein YddW (UPF0748 family)